MKILLIGSGGREHALAWALARSPQVKKIYSATENAGVLKLTTRAGVSAADVNGVAEFAETEKIDLVVVGPEQPLVDGLVDALSLRGIAAFGPIAAAARLEGSKVFAKEFMARNRIPTARWKIVENAEDAKAALGEFAYPVVIKAEGLAAGKGVIIAQDKGEAEQAILDLLVNKTLGDAGSRLVIEECLVGRELSYLVFSDGKDSLAMPVAQDHKRQLDGDRGPNTGGMGAFSTPGLLDPRLEAQIIREIVEPTLDAARAEGFPFQGVLYCGLMLTERGPMALEYNVRFGDPETQSIMRRLDSDFVEIALASAQGTLAKVRPQWTDDSTTCIVLASEGYPGKYPTGRTITGLEAADELDGVVVFHAGTKLGDRDQIVTAGGRVLGVTARAATLDAATKQAYAAIDHITFDGMQRRRDIGRLI
jgi:phosphoribosylamine---glycine ligase